MAFLCAAVLALPVQAAPFAATIMDARTGQILHSANDTARLHPASLTKMMTLYVAFEAIRNGEISLDTMVRVSRRAASEPPSRLGLREGQRIALRHLIRAAALRSGNDAATAIAEAVSGSVEAFAQRMTRTGAAMGMTATTFRNAHGLTQAGHLSTARDMTILGRQLFFDFPEYYALFSRRSEDAGIARVANTNSRFLDGYRGADGIKTGFTNAAGYNLTAMAERDGVRIIVTVFGGRSVQHRHEQVTALMDRGFRAAPTRAAVRRPARPNYSRPTASASATGPARNQTPAPTESRAAGRVIRLQTAPARSVFPQRRPVPGEAPTAAPAPELLAALQTGIGAALAELSEPDTADPDMPAAEPVPRARGAVARSLVPQTRPATVLAAVAPPTARPADPAVEMESDIQAARAAGFSVIDPGALAEVLATAPEAAPEIAADRPPASPVSEPAAEPVAVVAIADLPPRARLSPAARPDPLPQAAQAIAATVPAAPGTDQVAQRPVLADVAPGMDPIPDVAMLAAPFGPESLEGVVIADGLVVIPGLPPIMTAAARAEDRAEDGAESGAAGVGQTLAGAHPGIVLAPPPAVAAVASEIEPVLPDEPGLVVTAQGQVLWQDADVLQGLDQVAPVPAGPSPIQLTTQDMPAADRPAPDPIGDIVVRVSSSGGQMWGVDLGRYPSRFDAERTLLRIALAESAALSGGVRRVVERGGGFGAVIVSLGQDQADRACLRLASTVQSCTVINP